MSLSDTPENKRYLQRLKKAGYEDDEVKQLFRDDESLRKFIADLDKASKAEVFADDEEPEPIDSFKLSQEQENEALYQKKKQSVEAELAPSTDPDETVTFEDLLEAMKGLDDLPDVDDVDDEEE